MGDTVAVLGPFESQTKVASILGPSVLDELADVPIEARDVIVTRREASGRSLRELDLIRKFGCLVTHISRSMLELPVTPQLQLQRGDTIRAVGPRESLDQLAQAVGQAEAHPYETDLMTFAFGILAGLLIGTLTFKVGDIRLGLGISGGLLLSGILVGFLHMINPSVGRMPRSVRWVFMELGLVFFIAGVGLRAGPGMNAVVGSVGLQLAATGVVVTTATLLLGFLFGRYVLRMNAALLLGALTGAMTSTPALGIVTRSARSTLPSVGYAGTYPFANIVLAFVGSVLMRL